jgi:hypothetical protein
MDNHDAIVDAFKKADGLIKTCRRGGKPGYTHIHGPSCAPTPPKCSNHPLLIECFTGTVGFRKELGQRLQGPLGNKPRAEMQRDVKIQDDPLGRSAGKIGGYNYVFSSDMILDGWGTFDHFAEDVVNECRALGIW